MDFIDKKIKEFYETLTDQVDEENEYYDSQFEGTQPKTVESFIRKMFKEYQESNSGGNASYNFACGSCVECKHEAFNEVEGSYCKVHNKQLDEMFPNTDLTLDDIGCKQFESKQ